MLAIDAVMRPSPWAKPPPRSPRSASPWCATPPRPRQELIHSLQRVSDAHSNAFSVNAEPLSLPPDEDPGLLMKALRYALQRFLEAGADAARESFEEMLRQTLMSAQDFADMVKEQRFELAYQPIVDLRTGELAHFEVLARFGDGSPQKTILMAEALDLIEDFDLAVAGMAAEMLREPANRRLKLAINISARSLVRPFFLSRLWGRLGDGKGLGGRLIFEITETAQIADIAAANILVQQIRSRGFKVCLDDFGAGAASLAYLHGFNIDTVKIDGQYVRELTADGRDGTAWFATSSSSAPSSGSPPSPRWSRRPRRPRRCATWASASARAGCSAGPHPEPEYAQLRGLRTRPRRARSRLAATKPARAAYIGAMSLDGPAHRDPRLPRLRRGPAARAAAGGPRLPRDAAPDLRPGAGPARARERPAVHRPSGDRLRDWIGVDYETFYGDPRIGVAAMAFCFPGTDPKGGDYPPPPRCACLWRSKLIEQLPKVELTLLVGSYAIRWKLGDRAKASMTETVRAWRDYLPCDVPLPHPSWRNIGWLKRNPWFEAEVIPYLRERVAEILR